MTGAAVMHKGPGGKRVAGHLEAFAEHLRAAGRSPVTERTYRQTLSSFFAWYAGRHGELAELVHVTPMDVREYRTHLQEQCGRKPATVELHLGALKSFFGWAERTARTSHNPARDVRAQKRVRPAPRSLDRQAQGALRRAADGRILLADSKRPPITMTATAAEARRDKAILMMLLNTGLRLAELCALNLDDIELSDRGGNVIVRRGKGDKWRQVALNKDVRGALTEWLGVRPTFVQADIDALFVSRRAQRMSTSTVRKLVDRLAQAAKMPVSDVCPHVMRHTFARSLIEAGKGLSEVKELLGHDSIATTARYTTPSARDLAETVESIAWAE